MPTTHGRKVRQLFAFGNWKSERAVAYPGLFYLYVVGNILDELVDRRFVVHARCQARKVQEIHDRPCLESREVLQRFSRWPCFACSRIVPGLKNRPQPFGIALGPAACQRGIVVHKYIWTISDWPPFKECVNKNEELAILVARGIEEFFVGARNFGAWQN